MYRSLDPDKIVATVEELSRRIDERFPDFGLGRVCRELLQTARAAQTRSVWIARPLLWLRALVVILIVVLVLLPFFVSISLKWDSARLDLFQLIQVSESALNDVVLIGAALFFLLTLEVRIKRQRALRAIHEHSHAS